MRNNYSYDQLRLASHLYYVDGTAQGKVAKLAKISQPRVSRLLAIARERSPTRSLVQNVHESKERNPTAVQSIGSVGFSARTLLDVAVQSTFSKTKSTRKTT